MIPLHFLGMLCLLCALLFAVLQAMLPFIGWRRQNIYLLATARPLAWGQFFFTGLAYLVLTAAFVWNDFSLAYVAANSHPTLPLLYRISAVWGAHEGSILLWILFLNVWSFALSWRLNTRATQVISALALSTLGVISTAFLIFLIFTSNPFVLAAHRSMGADLNPLLQDPGLAIHPPMLYLGYVGFAATFALTQAALLSRQLNANWAHITREFALAAWCFLTLGITLGSWWAYRVLGWGGFWFWDPVENASLLPWLAATALIHVLMIVEKRCLAIAWAMILAFITFTLSLLGTFLVRSGVLVSAHTFASDPSRGVFLLLILGALVLCALLVAIIQLPKQMIEASPFHFFSREMGLLINSVILTTAMLTILLGTIYPLIFDVLHLGNISVGAPYFNKMMTPLLLLLMCFMVLGPHCRWQGNSAKAVFLRCTKTMLIAVVVAVAVSWGLLDQIDLFACAILTLCVGIILSVMPFYRLYSSMLLAHSGFALLVLGVLLSSLLTQEKNVRIKPGDIVTISPYQFIFLDTRGIQRDNYRGIQAAFDVIKHDRHVANLYPEKRIYLVRDMVMTNVAIHPGIFRDLYLALGEPLDAEYWSVRIYYKPFIRWIWLGGLLMMIGGVLTLWKKAKKVY